MLTGFAAAAVVDVMAWMVVIAAGVLDADDESGFGPSMAPVVVVAVGGSGFIKGGAEGGKAGGGLKGDGVLPLLPLPTGDPFLVVLSCVVLESLLSTCI